MDNATEGTIIGLPTMMAIFPGKVEVARMIDALQKTGHPLEDVSLYYRVKGTDQVIDAATGQIAAGQAISERDLHSNSLDGAETILLLHPGQQELGAIRQAISSVGEARIEYQEATKGTSATNVPIEDESAK